jgi:predicted aspartyl protease
MRSRIIITLAAMLCVMPHADPSRSLQPKSAPDVSMNTSVYSTGEVTVPFEYFKQHIYVPVSLQGKPGFIFMLDSGASKNILNLRTARQLGLHPGTEPEKNVGFGYERIYVAPQENLSVELGAVPMAHKLSVMDLNKFELHFSHATDGMLGYPFFLHHVVKVDFQTKLVSIYSADRYVYRGFGMKVRSEPGNGAIVLHVTLASERNRAHRVDVIVDTGSNVSLLLYKNFLRTLDLEKSLRQSVPAQAFGLNGYYAVQRGTVDALQIGDVETRNPTVDYLEKNEDLSPNRSVPGAIGNGILQGFRSVTFDLPHHRVIFELPGAAPDPTVVLKETMSP